MSFALSTTDAMVIAGGLAAIGWVNWYFFLAERSAPAAMAASSSTQARVTVVVDGGYTPARIAARAGQPLELVFDRRDTGSCSDEVVIPEFGVRTFLRTGKQTSITVTPTSPGRYEFTCGMGMHRGVLLVEA